MKEWRAIAPAKINLTLDITGIKENGYHELTSCFHTLQLADELRLFLTKQKTVFQDWCAQFSSSRRIPFAVEPTSSPLGIRGLFVIDGPIHLEAAKNNLILRAIYIFLYRLSTKTNRIAVPGLTNKQQLFMGVYIDKHIPFEAGLGGGSSDAAAVLRILNQIFAYPFDLRELSEIGVSLGMDIPFSIIGGAAELNGVGFEVTPVQSTMKYYVLLFKPPQGMPTNNSYARIDALSDEVKAKFRPNHKRFMQAFSKGINRKALHFGGNIFHSILVSEMPEIMAAHEFINRQGSHLTALCGSGSCSFAIFSSRRSLYCAKKKMLREYPDWWIKSTMLNPQPHKNYLKAEEEV